MWMYMEKYEGFIYERFQFVSDVGLGLNEM